MGSISESTTIIKRETKTTGIKMENPFTLKMGQVFTGFGVGCGLGIGVGRPINMGAIPVVNQVMGAARGATDTFSVVGRHVNDAFRKVGAKNIEAGIGCGVGFGHGFGVGLAVKPGVMNQIQARLVETMTKMLTKFGIAPNLSMVQSVLPPSLQSGMNMVSQPSGQNPMGGIMQPLGQNPMGSVMQPSGQNPMGSIMQLATSPSQGLPKEGSLTLGSAIESFTSKGATEEASFGSRTEKVLSSFLQNTVMKEEGTGVGEQVVNLQSENRMLRMMLKHQEAIEELMEENEKLRQILVEDLGVPPDKLDSSNTYPGRIKSSCSDCFECRRKQRRKNT